MSKTVLVPIADGSEELETVAIIDILRRAKAEVTVASVANFTITASRGVKLKADCLIRDCKEKIFDMIALPGGIPGAEHLRDSQTLIHLLMQQQEKEKWLAAICASPAVVLQHHGLLKGKTATCHPAFRNKLHKERASNDRVVVDGNLITSQGPGTAVEFALQLVTCLFGKEHAERVGEPMVLL